MLKKLALSLIALLVSLGAAELMVRAVGAAPKIYLISKGRTRGIRLFRVPAQAWSRSGNVTAELLDSLPLPDRNSADWVTDAARLPGTNRVVVRSYSSLYFFQMKPDGRLEAPASRVACDVTGLEAQGEGVEWLDSLHLVLTSERGPFSAGTIRTIQCLS